MKLPFSRENALAIILAGVAVLPAPAANRRDSIEQLTNEADKIVLGSVTSRTSYWGEHDLIYTDAVVVSDVTLKGDEGNAVVVQVPGGVVGDTEVSVSDAPELNAGDRLVLFLKRKGHRFEVVGRDAGKYEAGGPDAASVLEAVFGELEKSSAPNLQYRRSLAAAFLARTADALTTTTTTTTSTSTCYSAGAVKWAGGAGTYKLGATVPSTWAASIAAAASTWTNAGAAFSLTSNSTSANELTLIDLVAKYGSSYSNTYALATVWSNTTTNAITKATIEINNRFQWSTTAAANTADVQNILTHEFGHWLRLGDIYSPSTCGEVTMWATSMLAEVKKRTLDQADIDGLIALYGRKSSIAAPALLSPGNAATGASTGATLTWSAASGATSYSVYFGTSSAPPLAGTVTTASYKPATMAAGTKYYWRVVANSSNGSASSSTWSFTTAAGALTAPVLVSPANGATGVSLTPTLKWYAVTGATSYDVYFGTTSSPGLIGSVAGTSVTISGLRNATVYYWKIVARGSTGSASSSIRYFRTL